MTDAYEAIRELIEDLLAYKRDEDSVYLAQKLLDIRDLMRAEGSNENGLSQSPDSGDAPQPTTDTIGPEGTPVGR